MTGREHARARGRKHALLLAYPACQGALTFAMKSGRSSLSLVACERPPNFAGHEQLPKRVSTRKRATAAGVLGGQSRRLALDIERRFKRLHLLFVSQFRLLFLSSMSIFIRDRGGSLFS